MDCIEIFVRIKNKENLERIELIRSKGPLKKGEIMWESNGEYRLEVFQCTSFPSDCSIEKDPRILNPKNELALLILDAMKNKEVFI